jgi:hypothetical protein
VKIRRCGKLLAAVLLIANFSARADQPSSCDRACLDDVVDRYLQALLTHDPTRAPLADTVRFTEDGQALKPGDGLWGTISGLGAYRHIIEDPHGDNVAFFGTVREGGDLTILALRLKVQHRKISEIESFLTRNQRLTVLGIPRLEAMTKPEEIWFATVPPEKRATRQQLIETANQYFSGLQNNDGHGVYPFADDCNRIENGLQTTNNPQPQPGVAVGAFNIWALGCKAQFESGFFRMVTRIRDRRFLIVDPERGIVFSFVFFDHSGTVPAVTLTTGQTMPMTIKTPLTWELAEAFKIEDGKIRRVEAALTRAPYGMKPGWPP